MANDGGRGAARAGRTTGGDDVPASAAGGEAAPEIGYEQAREELADVVRRLEAGGTGLEEALALWERGEALAAICQRWLEGARQRLDAARAAAERGEDADG